MSDAVAKFSEDALKTRLLTVAALIGGFDEALLQKAIDAIELRNEVVHRGALVKDSSLEDIRALLEVTAQLLDLPRKFPHPTNDNALADPTAWEKTRGLVPIQSAGGEVREA